MKALEYAAAAVLAMFFAMLLFSGSAAETAIGIDGLTQAIEQLNK
jgi:hypothetical protein